MKKLPKAKQCEHNNLEIKREIEFVPYIFKGFVIERDKPMSGFCFDCKKDIEIKSVFNVIGKL